MGHLGGLKKGYGGHHPNHMVVHCFLNCILPVTLKNGLFFSNKLIKSAIND